MYTLQLVVAAERSVYNLIQLWKVALYVRHEPLSSLTVVFASTPYYDRVDTVTHPIRGHRGICTSICSSRLILPCIRETALPTTKNSVCPNLP